jgi:hypothetical protein
VLFPVGELHKERVRALAAEAGLAQARKKSSTGICFVGKRRFPDFIAGDVTLGSFAPAPGQASCRPSCADTRSTKRVALRRYLCDGPSAVAVDS